MTISFVGADAVMGDSIAIPVHQAGDLLIMITGRGQNVLPTTPSGWIQIGGSTGLSSALTVAYKFAESDSETSGTWTNAEALAIGVYRSTTFHYPSRNVIGSNSLTVDINYPALAEIGRTAWYVGAIFIAVNTTDAEAAPSGMTTRAHAVGTREIAIHDTNGATSSGWPSTSFTPSVTASQSRKTVVIEIDDTGLVISAGGSSGSRLVGPSSLVTPAGVV